MNFTKLIIDLSNPNQKRATSASADLASENRAGSIDEATLSHWLPIPTRCGFIGDGSTVQSTPE